MFFLPLVSRGFDFVILAFFFLPETACACRKLLERKRRQREHRHSAATVIQRHYRGVVARVHYVILCEKRQVRF